MSWRLRAARQKCSREKRRRHEEFGKRADGVHGRMGSVLFLFCERGATHDGFAARTRAAEGIAEAGLEPSREQRQIGGREEKSRDRALPTWRAGFVGGDQAVPAEPVSRSGHYSFGAARDFAADNCEADFLEAVGFGTREVSGKWRAF